MLDPLELLPDRRIGHIVAADTADAVLVAPATARWLAAMANGLADDVVTATCLATTAPVVVAPAMDGEMYAHPATPRQRRAAARASATRSSSPRSGPLASGAVGRGRLAETARSSSRPWRPSTGRPVRAARPGPAPAASARRAWPGPGGLARRRHRRRHRRADRPGPLHRQPLDRADGRRHRRGGARPRRAGDAHPRA